MIDLPWESKIALAALPVLWIASSTFGRPSWSRSYTTAAFYCGAWSAYVALHLIVLVMVCAALRRGWGVQSTVWIGLGITLLLSACSEILRYPREWLHKQAGIPSKAHSLAKELAQSHFNIDPQTFEDATQLLIMRGVDVDEEWDELGVPARRLRDAAALFLTLRRWEGDRRFKSFLSEADNDFYALRRHFDQLSFKVPRTLDSIRRLGSMLHVFHSDRTSDEPAPVAEFEGISHRVVSDLINDACKDIADFYDEACLLAARGALARHVSGKGRQALLRGMGFSYEDDSRPTPIGVLAKAGLLLYVGIWAVTLILPNEVPRSGDDISDASRVAMITVITLTALGITVFIKQRWGFANAGLDARTPKRFLIGAAVCASLFAVVMNLATGALLLGGWHGALTRLSHGWPFLHFSGVTAITVAWLVQDHRWRRTPSTAMRRLFDASMLALVWVAASCISLLLLMLMLNVTALNHSLPIAERVYMALRNPQSVLLAAQCYGMPLLSLVFGAVLGATVPESVRRAYPRMNAPRVRQDYGAAGSGVGA